MPILDYAFTSPSADLDRLTAGLGSKALAADLVDVAYTFTDSPVGRLLLAATPVGMVRISFDVEDHDAQLDRLAREISPRVVEAPSRLDLVRRELDAYFARTLTVFTVPLDRALASGFRRTVQEHLSTIPYGETESYADVARLLGNAGASRAVGTACATNPLPIIVPCHRVLRSDGTLGGYAGGLPAKLLLLDLERTTLL
jgi:methylated-DNA-[protein]-cysteine S-methyltransferase